MKKSIGLSLFLVAMVSTQAYSDYFQISTHAFGGGCITNVEGYAQRQTCNNGSNKNQLLTMTENDTLRSPLTNQCLTAHPSFKSGVKIVYTQCQEDSQAQTFVYSSNTKRFLYPASEKCLSIDKENKIDLTLDSCSETKSQRFDIQPSRYSEEGWSSLLKKYGDKKDIEKSASNLKGSDTSKIAGLDKKSITNEVSKLKDSISKFIESGKKSISKKTSKLKDDVSKLIKSNKKEIKDKVSKLKDNISKLIKSNKKDIKDKVSKLKDDISKFVEFDKKDKGI
ncbi:MAG: RICIN domain-containing protein [Sulfurovum sp.]|nr:RICIN domain-containing protein [Sulfurovum sp.]